MEQVKNFTFDILYKKIFGKNVHFTSDCEFFPNFDVVIKINDNFKEIIDTAIEDDVEIVYVLPTYTAVFETRDYIEKVVKSY